MKTAGQLSYLAGGVGASDFSPTASQRDVQGVLAKDVRDTRAALDQVLRVDLPAFNALLRAKGLKVISLEGPVF